MALCPYGGPGLGMGMGRLSAGYGLWLPITLTIIVSVIWYGLDFQKKWYEQKHPKWKYDPLMITIVIIWTLYLLINI